MGSGAAGLRRGQPVVLKSLRPLVCYDQLMLALAPVLLAGAAALLPQELETAAGAPFSLEKALARAPVVLVFWNSWLPESEAFLPLLREVEDAAATNGWPGAVVVFQDDGDAWTASIGATGGVLPRVLDRRGALLRQLKVTRAPAVLVVGRDGAVLDRSGPDPAQVRGLLAALARRAR
jgi:thiol-disulfide isomerase/thioredoxin